MADANSAYRWTTDARRGAASARRAQPDDDRAAAGRRRHRRPCATAGPAEDADLSGREHPLGRTTRVRRSIWAAAGSSTSRSSRAGWLERGAARARPVSDAREVPVWCGGMHEFGVGRAANVAICSLPGFTLPGDVSGSDRSYPRGHRRSADPRARRAPSTCPGIGRVWASTPISSASRPAPLRELVLEEERAHGGTLDEPRRRLGRRVDAPELEPRRDEMVDLLGRLVEHRVAERRSRRRSIASPTSAAARASLADSTDRVERSARGRTTSLARRGRRRAAGRHAVVLCHYDTVWSLGTLDTHPVQRRRRGRRAWAGLLRHEGRHGRAVVRPAGAARHGSGAARPLEVLFTSDEEVGSPTSRPLIEEHGATVRPLAVRARIAAARAARSRRRARERATTSCGSTGRAAHAGVEPQKGISATQELAHQILALHALNDYRRRVPRVNVGVVHGGTRPNVVAAEAEAHVDVRVADAGRGRTHRRGHPGARSRGCPGAVLRHRGRAEPAADGALGGAWSRCSSGRERIAAAMGVRSARGQHRRRI